MNLAVLYSGGKDSNLALWYALNYGEVRCLISIVSKNPHSFMFHTPNIDLVKLQAKAIGLPLIIQETEGKKEIELKDLKEAIKKAKEKYKIEGVVSGAVKSVYQASRIQKICKSLGVWCFNPLWLREEKEILKEMKKAKFEVIISSVAAWPLDNKEVGMSVYKVEKIIDYYNKKYNVNISKVGEGGEFETAVLDAVFFKYRIKIIEVEKIGECNTWTYKIKKATLMKK